jgi:hypothetical protein
MSRRTGVMDKVDLLATLRIRGREGRADGRAMSEARRVIDNLPSDVPNPAILVEDDGDVSLEWSNELGTFALRVGSDKRVYGSGVSAGEKASWGVGCTCEVNKHILENLPWVSGSV